VLTAFHGEDLAGPEIAVSLVIHLCNASLNSKPKPGVASGDELVSRDELFTANEATLQSVQVTPGLQHRLRCRTTGCGAGIGKSH
jgi:hypothetical protein